MKIIKEARGHKYEAIFDDGVPVYEIPKNIKFRATDRREAFERINNELANLDDFPLKDVLEDGVSVFDEFNAFIEEKIMQNWDDGDAGDDKSTDECADNDEVIVTESIDEGTAKKVIAFGCKLLQFITEVHLWHLNCKKNSHHNALNDLYYGLLTHADSLLECCLANTSSDIPNGDLEYEFGDLQFNDAAIEKIRKIGDEASSIEVSDAGIRNILDDVSTECSRAVYKLKRLA